MIVFTQPISPKKTFVFINSYDKCVTMIVIGMQTEGTDLSEGVKYPSLLRTFNNVTRI